MPAPLLRSLVDAPASLRSMIPALPQGARAFVVVEEGRHAGESFGVGDVVVCAGDLLPGDVTVLVALGHGRPRFGAWSGSRLLGDAGEPCHPARWQAAGRWVGTWRHTGAGWRASGPAVEALHAPQLELFAQAA